MKIFFIYFLLPASLIFTFIPQVLINLSWLLFSFVTCYFLLVRNITIKYSLIFLIVFALVSLFASVYRGFGFSPLLFISSALILGWYSKQTISKSEAYNFIMITLLLMLLVLFWGGWQSQETLKTYIGLNRFAVSVVCVFIVYLSFYCKGLISYFCIHLLSLFLSIFLAYYSYIGGSRSTLILSFIFLLASLLPLYQYFLFKFVFFVTLLLALFFIYIFFDSSFLLEYDIQVLQRLLSTRLDHEPRYLLLDEFYNMWFDWMLGYKGDIDGMLNLYEFNLHNSFLTAFLYSGFFSLPIILCVFFYIFRIFLTAEVIFRFVAFMILFKIFTDNVFVFSLESFFVLFLYESVFSKEAVDCA